jgi:hypothetical protein
MQADEGDAGDGAAGEALGEDDDGLDLSMKKKKKKKKVRVVASCGGVTCVLVAWWACSAGAAGAG